MTETTPRLRKRPRFWLGLALIAMGLLLVPVLFLSSSSRLEAELARLRAERVLRDIEDLAPQVPPGEKNAADVYQQAFAALRFAEADRDRVADIDITRRETSAPRREALLLSMARRVVPTNLRAIGIFDRASEIQHCTFRLYQHEYDPTTVEWARSLKDFSVLLALRMRLLVAERKEAEALSTYATALRAAAHVLLEPSLLSGSAAGDLYWDSTEVLQAVLSSCDPSPAECRHLFALLAALDLRSASVRTQQVCLADRLTWFEDVRAGRSTPASVAGVGGGRLSWSALVARSYASVGRPLLLDRDESSFLQIMRQVIPAEGKPYPDCHRELTRAWQQMVELPAYRARITQDALPGWMLTTPSYLPGAARLGAAQTALALRGYRAQHGRYPDALRTLEQDGWTLPLDPYTGKYFRYRREGKGFVVCSLGEDMKDQNRQSRSTSGASNASSAYDIPFRCNR